MADVEHRPTVLLVGQGEPMQTELGEALRRHGISVAGCATAELETAVRVYAPDLVVLIGDAAVRGGSAVIRRMASNRGTDILPVAVVSNDAAIKQSDKRFRSGAVAVVPRGAGADAIARRLAELAVEVPERPGMLRGRVSSDNLQDVVELVSNETKTGILSLRTPEGPVDAVPIVVETEGAGAHNMERILDRLRDAMDDGGSLEFEFHETSGGRLSALPGPIEPDDVDLSQLRGARIVVLDSNELRAERLAQVLIQRGVQIAAADFSPAVIPRIREIDPQIVVIDSSAVGGQGVDFVRALRKDTQLRWASMLVVRWEDFWPSAANGTMPDIAQLATRICPLIEQDHVLARRVEDEVDFDTRLELVGPGRLLRALGSVPGVRHVALAGHKRSVEIDIADNSIVGAYATLNEGTTAETLQGMPALLAAWGMTAGRVSVREQDLPSVANIMMPVDEALGVVSHQLAFADGSNADIEVDAETVPPQMPEVDEHATAPPGANDPSEFDEARTMSPPRFAQRRAANAPNGPAPFPEEETPTNKVAQLLGRVETKPHSIPAARGAMEANAGVQHVDHAVGRSKKATQMGLAPVFEALPEGHRDDAQELQELEELEVPEPRAPKPPPPPPPQFQASTRPPMFEEADDLEPLAAALEGRTIAAPPLESRGTPAWIQVLLLVTLVAGVGVAGWLLWSQSGSVEIAAGESGKGPITGSVNGLDEADAGKTPAESTQNAAPPGADPAGGEAANKPPADDVDTKKAEPQAPEPNDAPAAATAPKTQAAKPAATNRPAVPTQGLPRDPAKASDVLVHRALPLIRKGKLGQAQATLDRAWELDPRNPQAMAGYARLHIAAKNGDEAVKWARKAVRKRAKRASYHVLYGDALTLQGKTNEARTAYRKALSVDPKNRTARSRLSGSSAGAAK
jgi:CheY-like chemotaxis protein